MTSQCLSYCLEIRLDDTGCCSQVVGRRRGWRERRTFRRITSFQPGKHKRKVKSTSRIVLLRVLVIETRNNFLPFSLYFQSDVPLFFLTDSSPPVLVDQSPAPATSFLAQECNATVKYAASGKYRDLVPSSVYHLYPSAKKMLKSGFFAVEVIPKVLEKESAITKVLKNLNLVFCVKNFESVTFHAGVFFGFAM